MTWCFPAEIRPFLPIVHGLYLKRSFVLRAPLRLQRTMGFLSREAGKIRGVLQQVSMRCATEKHRFYSIRILLANYMTYSNVMVIVVSTILCTGF